MAIVLVSGCGGGTGTGSASGSASAPATGDDTAPAFPKTDADTVVHVEAHDYRYTLDMKRAQGPKVFFEVKNAGKHDHEFEVVGADGKTVDEIPEFAPDQGRTLAVELSPGTYTLRCLLVTGGKTHADLGMTTEFRVS